MHNMQRIILAFLLLMALVSILMVTRKAKSTTICDGRTDVVARTVWMAGNRMSRGDDMLILHLRQGARGG